ncbi:integrase [Antarcticirhabdus aurantiaca]|uniref:Integrase n=1 Tax=Antarcticirhabdus aurantiaca TaxID=2606717 RepID=A0ACD4NWV1_9HYPH|nr:integrase [Antarcticirhabdus aurantiaca]WAJ31183.1 integrase [Jeongeuplla avenae]
MASETLPRWIVRIDGRLHYRPRVPTRYAALDTRRFVTLSCGTNDVAQAIVARDALNRMTESFWQSLARGDDPNARERYRALVDQAHAAGFAYVPLAQLRTGPLAEIDARMAAVEEALRAGGASASKASALVVGALLGREDEPPLTLSTVFAAYEDLTREARLNKSDNQVRKWRLPRQLAFSNLIDVVGDKPIADFTRSDALAFRAWWIDRIADEELLPDTANKQFVQVGTVIATVSDRLDLDLKRHFRGLSLKQVEAKRPPFSTAHIREVLLRPGALDALNAGARGIILTMIETGARPVELAHLRPKIDIRLDAEIPHISIAPYERYSLKTKYSERTLPLVGVAIEGAKLLMEANRRYQGRTDALSAVVNKFLVTNELLENPDQSIYSLRHSFKDRLTDVSTPDTMETALMGHKFDRPGYGSGPTLERKLEWIRKIAVSTPAC